MSTLAISPTASSAHPLGHESESQIPLWVRPDTASLLFVKRGDAAFTSSAISKVSLPAGALFARITTATFTERPTWSSVQTGRNSHIELNSDLVYINHSCDPSLEFDMTRFEVRVARNRPLRKGQELTFFYPSTEWEMAQTFSCCCAAADGICLGDIQGAASLDNSVLDRYHLNDHIRDLLVERRR